MSERYHCENRRRRDAVRGAGDDDNPPHLNGIDYLEVEPDQHTLRVHFVHPLTVPADQPGPLTDEHVVIEGGVRIRGIRAVEGATAPASSAPDEKVWIVPLDAAGDFSSYTFRLAATGDADGPPPGIDPQLDRVPFSFKVDCPSPFDCRDAHDCEEAEARPPRIDYLAKDYASFRRLMLDRLGAQLPDWRERSPADLQVTLVEALAYVADHLSYHQDAVATEAYLGTARRRTSVRRHARLLDYDVHDGSNARAWVHLRMVEGREVTLAPRTDFLTRIDDDREGEADQDEIEPARLRGAEVFRSLHERFATHEHNEFTFHTWSDDRCCLSRGATRATLRDSHPGLRPGDVLILVQRRCPTTGRDEDADPTHRQTVRLTDARIDVDPLDGQPITEIAWHPDDALGFPLCLWSEADPDALLDRPTAVALGNVVLVDHGESVEEELPPVPDEARFRLPLSRGPLTHGAPYAGEQAAPDPGDATVAAAAAMRWDRHDVLPHIELSADDGSSSPWTARRDLLGCDAFDESFVVETEDDGRAWLRFGDGVHGRRPTAGTRFTATYRVGNGRAGNVGAGAIALLVGNGTGVAEVRNPLPAEGGDDPESLEEVRQYAPQAFRRQERAVTPEDYARAAERHPDVQRAAATLRWTGSWHTMFISVDRRGGRPVDAPFVTQLRALIERLRMAGHDIEIEDPVLVPLHVEMAVCVDPDHRPADVHRALLDAFSDRDLPGGDPGFFHPDRFTFGQPVYTSRIHERAQAVPGVTSVELTSFQRWGRTAAGEIEDGVLPVGRLEVVQLANDPNFPENGRLAFAMQGGR